MQVNETVTNTSKHHAGVETTAVQQEKHNCYTCKHRRNIPGDCHSGCEALPDIDQFALAGYVYRNGPNFEMLKLNPHGVRSGWCLWPVNFDPCWVNECKFYEGL